mmetsp:Transcript_37360/g.83149  ORF Transcript_37360/g.83149 Transcript_37360/m.83149 type:complete len:114 (+) Transcript_37360:385-726(+)
MKITMQEHNVICPSLDPTGQLCYWHMGGQLGLLMQHLPAMQTPMPCSTSTAMQTLVPAGLLQACEVFVSTGICPCVCIATKPTSRVGDSLQQANMQPCVHALRHSTLPLSGSC